MSIQPLLLNPTARIALLLVVASAVAVSTTPQLGNTLGLGAVFDRANVVGLVALGLTVCLIAGQIDLSIGPTVALAGVIAIQTASAFGSYSGLALGILAGGLVGLVNAGIVVWLGVPSLIATLGTMLGVRSIALVVADSQPVSGKDIELALTVAKYVIPSVSVMTMVWVIAAVLLGAVLSWTKVGRNLFAVGGGQEAARAAGIPASRYVAGSLVISGLFAGVAGVMLAASLNTGSPVVGDPLLLTGLAAAVIGGATLTGGRGSALGAVLGVLAITLETVSMEFGAVPTYVQQIVIGATLIAVLLLDRLTGRRHP